MRGKINSDISLMEDLLYLLPDLFFHHGASMRSRSRTSKPCLRIAGVPMGGRAAQVALGVVGFQDSSSTFAPPARAKSLGWAMLGSNQRPLPCESSKIACQSVVELAKSLQIAIFVRAHCALDFRRFTLVCCMVAVQGYSLMRTRSGMIVIRLATWRPLLRATSWVTSANFVIT